MTENWEQPELPFDELPPVDRFTLKNFQGCAVVIAVGGYHPVVQTKFDPAPAMRVAVVVLNGPQEGDEYPDSLIFNAQPLRILRPYAGRAFVGHVDLDTTFSNPAPVLLPPSPEEKELALKWHAANPARCNELIHDAVAAFTEAEAKIAAPMPTQRQQQPQQQRSVPPSSPPKGPNYGGTKPAAETEPGPPPPPRSSGELNSAGDDEPPF